MPVTCAPRRAIASARMPPPQPTSSTLLAGEARVAVDPFQAQRIDLVQRPELALRVPPAVGQLAEFLELCGVRVSWGRF